MMKLNKNLEMVMVDVYARTKETDKGAEYLVLSESSFNRLEAQVEKSDKVELKPGKKEGKYTLESDNQKIRLSVEKQIHQKVDKTWKIDGKKFEDGTTIKLNGTFKGDYEVWSNATINSKGRRSWKRLSVTKTEEQGKKNLSKAIKAYKSELKEVKEA